MNTIVKMVLVVVFVIWFGQETVWAMSHLNNQCIADEYNVILGRCGEEQAVVGVAFGLLGLALAYVIYKLIGKIID